MAFRVHVHTFAKFFPSQELETQEVNMYLNEDSKINMMNVFMHL